MLWDCSFIFLTNSVGMQHIYTDIQVRQEITGAGLYPAPIVIFIIIVKLYYFNYNYLALATDIRYCLDSYSTTFWWYHQQQQSDYPHHGKNPVTL